MLWIALQPGLEAAAGPAGDPVHQTSASGRVASTASLAEADQADQVDQAGQGADLQALVWQALAYTPRVTRLEEAVLMEVSASVRLFGGLQALLKRLVREHAQARAAALASAPASGVAPALRGAPGHTALAALARLRTGLPWRQSSRLALGDLPLFTLSAAHPHAPVLARLGCRDWNDLRQLPREGLARRFGQPLLTALDQAFGEQPESHNWLTLPEVFDDSLELPALVEQAGALMFGVNRLLDRLRLWLLARGRGVLGLQLRWLLDPRRDVARSGELTLRLSEATQDMAHVARLLAEHLAQQQLPAPAHTLRLFTLDTAPLSGHNHSLLMQDRPPGDSLAQLVERLSARLGPERVLRWQAQDRHVPERMQCWVPAQTSPQKTVQTTAQTKAQKAVAQQGALPASTTSAKRARQAPPVAVSTAPSALLPSWLLEEPLPLALQGERPCYEGPLRLLVGPQRLETTGWAGRPDAHNAADRTTKQATKQTTKQAANKTVDQAAHQKAHHTTGQAAQPAAGEAPVMRDYFIARSEQAGLLWIFRERPSHADDGPAGWFLQGIFA